MKSPHIIRSVTKAISTFLGDQDQVASLIAPSLDRRTLQAQSGMTLPEKLTALELAETYMSTPELQTCSPNPVFSELGYRARNTDVREAIEAGDLVSGFVHFLLYGCQEGRLPNTDLAVCYQSPAARLHIHGREGRYFARFIEYFPQFSVDELARRYIVLDGVEEEQAENFYKMVSLVFDHDFYLEQRPELRESRRSEALVDYFNHGMRNGLSPVRDFDEAFYLAFYDDVRNAVRNGDLLCGFHHYYITGQSEGRLGRHKLRSAIEVRVPNLTAPDLVRRVDELESKIRGARIVERSGNDRVIHVVLPDLNPDIEFAGYKSLIELVKELGRRGKAINIVKGNSAYDGLDYFLYHNRDDPETTAIFRKITSQSVNSAVHVGRNDRVMAYSTWDTYIAKKIASQTTEKRFSFLIQEYEPVFYEYNSVRFLCDQSYSFDYFPIFNSQPLADFFRDNRIGAFSRMDAGETPDFHVFDHVVPRFDPVTIEARQNGLFFMYARPESHAGRNIFEINVLALRQFLRERQLEKPWSFLGLGSLSEVQSISLGPDHSLTVRNRLPFSEYMETVRNVDIGLSLMYAPHPSVVPYELLSAGALVITNTFHNRSAERLSRVSPNLIPVDLRLDDIVRGLHSAFDRVEDLEARRAGVFVAGSHSWRAVCAETADQLESRDLV
ncbi:hypothetical protein [Histidinibacterium lentulum]|uniref:Uncharacterized protein n=1 Tax=Histidinibacterium lentulum TaxID=2480588 RepID=A0A3N2R7F1_9RHOB|nr:hypothetical protein [Histidinibacterium lentulum]ROU03410.1 hypothetical protein EAT49_03635 [Histidinibacterium lentulum]